MSELSILEHLPCLSDKSLIASISYINALKLRLGIYLLKYEIGQIDKKLFQYNIIDTLDKISFESSEIKYYLPISIDRILIDNNLLDHVSITNEELTKISLYMESETQKTA